MSSFETLHSHSPDVDLLKESWSQISPDDRLNWFRRLSRSDAEELFLNLGPSDQAEWFSVLDWSERRSWLRLLPLDDSADLIQEFPLDERERLIGLLDRDTAADVTALLAYAEDAAGGLMNPRFVRLRPDVTVDVAVRYLRTQARKQVETIHYAYVIGPDAKLMGTVSFRDLLLASPDKLVSEIMETDLITVPEHMDQEEVSRKFSHHGLTAIPVVDGQGLMKGIVSVDDVVDVVQEEATEDMHKLGGTAALEDPYLQVPLFDLVKKRAGWLVLLFVSEMFTATVMGFYEKQIERAVVLALFIPLIISSGGNSGSQASTLIIRAMALGEVKLKDYGRVFFRELRAGLLLGGILGVIGLLRILFWPGTEAIYGPHYFWIGLTVSLSLLGIVLWGTLTGSMLPFLLKRFGLDPASASAPFVATLVDVTGIMIYFTLASLLLKGLLL